MLKHITTAAVFSAALAGNAAAQDDDDWLFAVLPLLLKTAAPPSLPTIDHPHCPAGEPCPTAGDADYLLIHPLNGLDGNTFFRLGEVAESITTYVGQGNVRFGIADYDENTSGTDAVVWIQTLDPDEATTELLAGVYRGFGVGATADGGPPVFDFDDAFMDFDNADYTGCTLYAADVHFVPVTDTNGVIQQVAIDFSARCNEGDFAGHFRKGSSAIPKNPDFYTPNDDGGGAGP